MIYYIIRTTFSSLSFHFCFLIVVKLLFIFILCIFNILFTVVIITNTILFELINALEIKYNNERTIVFNNKLLPPSFPVFIFFFIYLSIYTCRFNLNKILQICSKTEEHHSNSTSLSITLSVPSFAALSCCSYDH